ncbi:MAG: 16S rRNA (guanine(527)-N(7))-methyltransferase RsmG [Clostridium sp.]
MNEEFAKQMQNELEKIDITLSVQQMEQFYKYYEMLVEWNDKVNLTAITQMDEVITKHFVDSLAINKVIVDIREKEYSLIDVGTGAGFPGIPLKIVFPNLKITLLDSLNKRVKFLDEVIKELKLTDIFTIHGRAEDFGHDNVSRETFDFSVSRAVANIATLSEYCMPFVKVGGYFISYKSGKIEEELEAGKKAIKKLGGEVETVINFELPNADERSFVKIKKLNKLSKLYPRKAGLPSKEPLK